MSTIVIAGDTSGSVTLQAPAVAGGTVVTLPATTGTAALTSDLLGVGQTWQDVTGSRALSTTYTNSTGKPIMIQIQASLNAGSIYTLTINGVVINRFGAPNLNGQCPLSAIVPAGATYSAAVTSGAGSLSLWTELR